MLTGTRVLTFWSDKRCGGYGKERQFITTANERNPYGDILNGKGALGSDDYIFFDDAYQEGKFQGRKLGFGIALMTLPEALGLPTVPSRWLALLGLSVDASEAVEMASSKPSAEIPYLHRTQDTVSHGLILNGGFEYDH